MIDLSLTSLVMDFVLTLMTLGLACAGSGTWYEINETEIPQTSNKDETSQHVPHTAARSSIECSLKCKIKSLVPFYVEDLATVGTGKKNNGGKCNCLKMADREALVISKTTNSLLPVKGKLLTKVFKVETISLLLVDYAFVSNLLIY